MSQTRELRRKTEPGKTPRALRTPPQSHCQGRAPHRGREAPPHRAAEAQRPRGPVPSRQLSGGSLQTRAQPTPGAGAINSRGLLWLRGGGSGFARLLSLPRLAGSIRITSWSKYAGRPENQSRHNRRLVNCTVAETHPSHPLPVPSPHPSPLLFVPLRIALWGRGKSDQNCGPPPTDFLWIL